MITVQNVTATELETHRLLKGPSKPNNTNSNENAPTIKIARAQR
jgi:hypothetical protein